MTTKVVNFGKTLWNHKKKVVFFGGLTAWGASYLNDCLVEQQIRSDFARKAAEVGEQKVPIDYQPTRILVFVDESDPLYFKNLNSFNKNVLPLLTLAGMDVFMQNAKDRDQLELLSRTADVRNCGGVLVIGSARHSAPPVLNGLFVDKSHLQGRAPIGIFDPSDKDDVPALCEKAMRIVQGIRKEHKVYRTKIFGDSTVPKIDFRLADIRLGWFDFISEKQSKFWIFGSIADRMAATWYFLKNFPEPIDCKVRQTSFCAGCRKCISEAKVPKSERQRRVKFWQRWIGRREQPGDALRRQYQNIVNDKCGEEHEMHMQLLDFIVENGENGARGQLELKTVDPVVSRWSAISSSWRELADKSSDSPFTTDLIANKLDIQFKVRDPAEKPEEKREKQEGEKPDTDTSVFPASIQESNSVQKLKLSESGTIKRIVVENLPHVVHTF